VSTSTAAETTCDPVRIILIHRQVVSLENENNIVREKKIKCYKPSRRSAAGLLVPARPSVRPRKPRPVATHRDNPIIIHR